MVDAIELGIRQRGPEAVGMLLIGLVRIALAVAVLIVLLLLQLCGLSALGLQIESIPFASISVISVALSAMATLGRQWGEGDASQAPTQEEAVPRGRALTRFLPGAFHRNAPQPEPANARAAPTPRR